MKNETIAVALSGGVDSSVSALLLKRCNKNLLGVHMSNWHDEGDAFSPCSSKKDLQDARRIAATLSIPFKEFDFSQAYYRSVFESFLENYKNGTTPNPDVLCNREIKFKELTDALSQQGVHTLATGHYAQCHQNKTGNNKGRFELHQARDRHKDQSYFLYLLTEATLRQVIFPLGDTTKDQTRTIARDHSLHVHNKKDSTGICFIGEKNFRQFLSVYLPVQKGEIRCLDTDQLLGEHSGYHFYTIGQRQGLGIGGVAGKNHAPWYVASKDIAKNILYVVNGEHPALYTTTLTTLAPHWIHGSLDREPVDNNTLTAKIRYRQPQTACTIDSSVATATNATHLTVVFEQPQRAVSPGQSIVFYNGSHCLGGAVIAG